MLELQNVSLRVGSRDRPLLDEVSLTLPLGHFAAIIGPSGCGKTSLLKLIAGIADGQETGDVRWKGRSLDDRDFEASEVSYVPQFSLAYEELTVRESVRDSLALRVKRSRADSDRIVHSLLTEVSLESLGNQQVKTLSGGQRRRLALAMELTSNPEILLADEVTSGLDMKSEKEVVHLLHHLSREEGRLIISVTHSLSHLECYDSILLMFHGRVVFHGPPGQLLHYFSLTSVDDLFSTLETRGADEWHALWQEYRSAFTFGPSEEPAKESHRDESRHLPGALHQFWILLSRRWRIFSRNLPQIFLQVGLIFGFPLIVAVLAWGGLPDVNELSAGLNNDVAKRMDEARVYAKEASKAGTLISGIVMFQVVLLSLMGANNSGREIASERNIFEKEKLAGLRPVSYLCSKLAFLSVFVVAQSVWMGFFIHAVSAFPGPMLLQIGLLVAVNLAMTSICLAVSSLLPSAEQASLVSIYFVGFQLPLSGALIALPQPLGMLIRPFISAYWGWSGILKSLSGDRFYDMVSDVAQSPLAPVAVCLLVLGGQALTGIVIAWIGCARHGIR